MKRLYFIAAALLMLAGCTPKNAWIEVDVPDKLARQWVCDSKDSDGNDAILLWDFTVKKNSLTFVHFKSEEILEDNPEYECESKYVYPVECLQNGDVYRIIFTDYTGEDYIYKFSYITETSAYVEASGNYAKDLRICSVTVKAIDPE